MGAFWVVFCHGFLLLLFVFGSSGTDHEVVINNVDVDEARNLLNSGYHYLDVRTEEEFKNGHVENGLNIPYMFNNPKLGSGACRMDNGCRVKNPKFIDQVLSSHDKEDRIIVGCQSGVRSVNATIELLRAEFKHVYNMRGGYIAWIENGFAVEKSRCGEL